MVKEISFVKEERLILNSYVPVVEGLAAYLGPSYEITLHSLENLDHSVIKIMNGFHTGRSEGSPITDLALRPSGRPNPVSDAGGPDENLGERKANHRFRDQQY